MVKFIHGGYCGGQKYKSVHKGQILRKQVHCWLLKIIILGKFLLRKFLNCQVLEDGKAYQSSTLFSFSFHEYLLLYTITNKTHYTTLSKVIYITYFENPLKKKKKRLTLFFLVLPTLKPMHSLELLIYF